MGQPTPYVPQHDYQSELGTTHGTHLDEDLEAVRLTFDELLANLELVQRDDGKLRNRSVHPDSLSTATLAMVSDWNPRGLWATLTVYAIKDVVEQGGRSYVCTVTHIAGTFSADRAAGKWIILDASDGSVSPFAVATGTGDAMVVALPIIGLSDGYEFRTRAPSANTVTAPTINPSNLGAITITKQGGGILTVGDYTANSELTLRYRASTNKLELLSTIPTFLGTAAGEVPTTVSAYLNLKVKGLKKSFGCAGDGVTDDATKINTAFASGKIIEVEDATFAHTTNLVVTSNTTVIGYGREVSIFAPSSSLVDGIIVKGRYNTLGGFKVSGGRNQIILRGETTFCTHNKLSEITLESGQTGLTLDGYTDAAKPCYWNRFYDVFVWKPAINGVLLTKSGAGDTPNSNRFHDLHVYSNAAAISGHGIYVEYGGHSNAFTDTEVGLSTVTPTACVRLGANASKTYFNNLYTETAGAITNVQLDAGSTGTVLIDLEAASAGSAILDNSGGAYLAFNAGFPDVSKFGKAMAETLKVGKVRYSFFAADVTPATVTFFDHIYNNAIPASGTYVRGAICWNSNVGQANGPTGWICTVGGTPGTWVPFGEAYLEGSKTFNPGAINSLTQATDTVAALTGAALGDVVTWSSTIDLSLLTVTCYVSAADTVKIVAFNGTAGIVTPASGTIYVRVHKR